jgi:hypothetical protein
LINFSILASLAAGRGDDLGDGAGRSRDQRQQAVAGAGRRTGTQPVRVNDGLSHPMMIVRETSAGARVVATNDGWGGHTALMAAFDQVGAFRFSSPTSKDARFFSVASPRLVRVITRCTSGMCRMPPVSSWPNSNDATPENSFTGTTPRLINLSVLKEIESAATLTAGFTIAGSTAKTLLVRAVGPSLGLAPFSLTRAMPAPMMTLANAATGVKLASSRDWDGDAQIARIADRVGAFGLTSAATRDAMLLVTLAPGSYTCRFNRRRPPRRHRDDGCLRSALMPSRLR